MEFDWDPEKALSNLRKHGVSFSEATQVWEDDNHSIDLDAVIDGEIRLRATGWDGRNRLLLVVHVDISDETIRIISARRATPRERREHEG